MAIKKHDDRDFIHEPNCKICSHPRRTQIEAFRLSDNYTYKQLREFMIECDGTSASDRSMSNHFNNHVTNKRKTQVMHWKQEIEKFKETIPAGDNKIEIDLHRLGYMENILAENLVLHQIIGEELQNQLATKIPHYHKRKNVNPKKKDVAEGVIGYMETYRPVVDQGLITLYKEAFRQMMEATNAKLKILGMDELANKEQQEIDIVNFMHKFLPMDDAKQVQIIEDEDGDDDPEIIDFND